MSTLDKHMLKELLLVCSALGTVEVSNQEENAAEDTADGTGPVGQSQRFVRGENCLEWLQDLQRALRRDDDNTREICITISSWRVVQQKLIPLIIECRDDAILVKTLFKIYVMLTMPLSKQAGESLLKPVNPKAEGDVRDQDRRKRENALAQQASLHAFKRAFISGDVLSVIVGMLEEPLSHIGVARTEEDNFSIELCLTLLRNVLNIKDPIPGMATSLVEQCVQMHEQLVALFQDALLLDILLLLAQDVHARENAKLNLLLVEIFHCVIRDQEPGAIIATHRAKVQRNAALQGSKLGPSKTEKPRGLLLSVLAREKDMRGNASAQMHRFGGTLQVGGENGTTARIVANPFMDRADSVPQAARKKTKKTNTFTTDDTSGTSQASTESHKAILAREALYDFSCSFLKTAYDPFMRSIKNEFRIDSSRLQPGDKGMMFQLMSFFMSFHHHLFQAAVKDAVAAGRKGADLPKFELGHVLETMDLMSFNLVLREVETAITEKNTKRLAECVDVLKEMMHIVSMLNDSSERAHQLVALGLLARVFYASEPLDKLQDIVRNWQPGKYSKSFLCHLVELVHTTLKTLGCYSKGKVRDLEGNAGTQDSKGAFDKDIADKMIAARKFDLDRYFRRLASNHTVRMYSSLLEYYATNSARTNHYILSFMMRLSNFKGNESSKKHREESSPLEEENTSTCFGLEALLYNVHTLGVFQKILDDPLGRRSAFKHLVQYIRSAARHFGTLAAKNRLVFVEAFFQHPNPQTFCTALYNVYYDYSGDPGAEDVEPRKKRKKVAKAANSDDESEDSDADDEQRAGGKAQSGGDEEEQTQRPDGDDTDEDEWEEQTAGKTSKSGSDNGDSDESGGKADAGRKRKNRGKGSRRHSNDEDGSGSGGKKRAARWTKAEDSYLREQYPIYANSKSVFAVLKAGDALEANDRTPEQIKRRVKKLGLQSLREETASTDSSASEVEEARTSSHSSANEDMVDGSNTAEEGAGDGTDDVAPASPVPGRKIKRKSQAQSDYDSEGLFSSPEDGEKMSGDTVSEKATSLIATANRQNKRAIFEDDSDNE